VELGLGLSHSAEQWSSVWRPVKKLNNRFDQLWCTLLLQLGEPEPTLARSPFTQRARMRLSPIVANFHLFPAEVLGNPLLSPRRLLELLKSRPVQVKPVDQWPCSQVPYQVQDRLQAELRRSAEEVQRLENKQVTLMGNLDYHLLREARKPPEKSDKRRSASPAIEVPRNFEEFLALVEAAFGRGAEESGEAEESGPKVPPCPNGDAEDDGGGGRPGAPRDGQDGGSDAEDGPRKPDPPPTVRDLAQLLWESATLPQRRAEEEARCLSEHLTDYATRLASSDPDDEPRRQRVAAQILKLFRQADEKQRQSVSINRRARLAMYDVAVARFGKLPELEFLIRPRDRMEHLYSEFWRLFFAEVHRVIGQEQEDG
jgi:hypothetical protein